MKKNLNLSFLENHDSSLMFGYLQHGFGMLEVARIAYTVATPNDWWWFALGYDYPNPSASARSIFSWACRFLGRCAFFELNIYSGTVNVLPLKYKIRLHANEPFNVYIIWILQLGEIPGVTPRRFIDPKLYLRFPSTSCITACLYSKCATPAAGFPKLSNDRRVFVCLMIL